MSNIDIVKKLKNHPNWNDWRWQMKNRISTISQLETFISLTEGERKGIEEASKRYRWSITPYYASLMDTEDASCPLRLQQIPSLLELDDPLGTVDPLEEKSNSPVDSVVHVYPDRVAFKITNVCPTYCRYCFREYYVGDVQSHPPKSQTEEGLDYIRNNSSIRDVLITGGDPAMLSDERLEYFLSQLRAIDHVEILRLGTRTPCTLPQRITEEFAEMLARYHPLWLNTHFNHPDEITEEAALACDRLSRAGIPLGNQTVLLAGVNDSVEVMTRLVKKLLKIRVRPYYIFQCQALKGTAHLRTSVEKGVEIIEALRGHVSGLAVPQYVLDTPYGKVPLGQDYLLGRDGDNIIIRTWDGHLWKEANPVDKEDPITLPQITAPDAESIAGYTGSAAR